jgi:acylglycerol lipase
VTAIEGAAHEEGRVAGEGGLSLYWQAWLPARPRVALLFVHGLGEHSGRYQHPGRYFAPRGFACYALDYRGHGKSSGPRVHVHSIDEFVSDVRAVHALVRERHPGLAAFVVGHSQGGLVVLRYALRHPEGIPGIVVNSPLLAIHPSSAPSAALRLVGRVLLAAAPGLLVPNGVDPRLVSRDPAEVEAYVSDPLVSTKVSAAWFAAVGRAQAEVRAEAGTLRVPALVMAASGDRLTDPDVTRRFAQDAPSGLLEFVCWEGLYHETFNEPEKEQVFRRMETWLEARLVPTTS